MAKANTEEEVADATPLALEQVQQVQQSVEDARELPASVLVSLAPLLRIQH